MREQHQSSVLKASRYQSKKSECDERASKEQLLDLQEGDDMIKVTLKDWPHSIMQKNRPEWVRNSAKKPIEFAVTEYYSAYNPEQSKMLNFGIIE